MFTKNIELSIKVANSIKKNVESYKKKVSSFFFASQYNFFTFAWLTAKSQWTQKTDQRIHTLPKKKKISEDSLKKYINSPRP